MATRRTVIRSALVGLPALLASTFPAASLASAEQNEFSARDREFLVTIRFANLWEIPVGRQVAERSDNEKVRAVGRVLLADHTRLNVAVEQLAQRFGVELPDKPSSKTQQWMDEISAASGDEYNRVFADRLRAAHGSVFSVVAEVRAGTRNNTIRDFAQTANSIVLKHMTLLEGTGYATMDMNGVFSEAGARGTENAENQLGAGDFLLGGVAVAVAAGATIGLVRTFSTHPAAE